MSVDQLPPGKARPAKRDAQLVRYDEYIDKQIETTRRNVKAVDVMTALLVMTTGALAFLLAAAVVEHWFVAGGFNVAVRLLLFVALVGGLSFYAARRLWPLCVGSINPAYAAQAIEQDNPSLKNSLLNLLLFRQHRDDITDAVYETLEEQAAQRLTHVPVDSAVDRSQLLRLGYVLMVIVAVAALYKILSPKDPFVTAERVLMPWASIVPASRVSIENVEPGTATLARGEVLTVSADVRGIGDDDPVVVRYTTADGQAVDRPSPMTPSAAGLRFTGQIPPPQDAAQGGVAQNLRYRIEAGDARSLEYSVTVVSAPTITVERIDYDYPDYTGFVDRSIERLGDVLAIEGTRVTIHARANQPIEEAAIDFEADGRRDVRFEASDGDARATFLLELRDDRQTPKFTSYVLRFTGTDGRPNRDPVKFPIDVLPDYGPEVAILAPAEKVRDVRLDETVAIEVDARDPDFALAEVRLHGDAAGRTVLDEKLLGEEHRGRFTGRILFTPSEHELQAGDIVRYWVTTRDNRTPQPNEVTSDSQTLRIVAPEPRQPGQPPQDRVAHRDKREPQAGDQSQEGQQQQGEGGKSGGESQPGESDSADGQSGQSDEQNSANQSGENSSGEQSNDQTGESETGGESSGDGQSSAGEQNRESGETQQQPGGAPSAGKNAETSEQDQSQQSAGGESSGEQRDANQSEANPGTNGQGGGEGSKNSQPQPGNRGQSKPGDEPSPVSPEGDNDGEAFERIQDFLKREGKLPKEGDSKPQTGESASADGNQSEDGKRNAEPNGEGDAQSNSDEQANPRADRTSEQPGAETRPGDSQEKTNGPSDQGKPSQPSGEQQTSSEGESGAGERPELGQGSPESQPNMKPGDKWQQKPSGEKQDNQQEPPSGGHGKRESDSQGDQGGDRSGGGEEGAGEKSQRDGTGSAGQNQSADEGAGESSEQSAGHNSPSAGQDAKSDDRTGQSSENQEGDGSSQRGGESNKPGGSENQKGGDERESGTEDQSQPGKDGEPASAGGDQSQTPNQEPGQAPSEQPNNGSQDSGASTADGAGRVPNGTMQPAKSTGTAPAADAANLEYSRKQTDLVLETLAEQMKRQKVDKRLLDELGWTEADLQRFLARWQQLKAAAQDDSPSADAAQRELDEALRSLGLRRGSLGQAKVSDDANRNLRQGYRGAVPLEYQERLRAYNQGVSRARPIDE